MKKIHLGLLLLPVTLLLVLVISQSPPAKTSQPETTDNLYLPSLPAKNNTILITDGQFTPHTLAVATGTTIRFVNHDTIPHTLTSNNGSILFPTLNPGQQYNWTANTNGIYPFSSLSHPATEGAIIVSPNGSPDWFDA